MVNQILIAMNTQRSLSFPAFALIAIAAALSACRKEESTGPGVTGTLTEDDKAMLLFMLEEEKLARDTYIALDASWSLQQFANIKNSEQTHMNRIADLLNMYGVAYTVLPTGQFANASLQALYDQFMIDGAQSELNALRIGATIEDLDIVDLQERMDATANASIDAVFSNLQCGSRNHLRSFVGAITNAGDSYAPQHLSQEDYEAILSDDHENCG